MWGSLLDCFYCLSLWTAIPFTLLTGRNWQEWLLLWLALSAGAIVLEELLQRLRTTGPIPDYVEDKEG
jgi:hypothetical protein